MSSSLLHLNDATRRPDPGAGPAPRATRAERVLRETIAHMRESGELCKGSEEPLTALALAVGTDRGGGPARCVAALFEHLETADGAASLHPEFKRPKGVSPLRKVLERLPIRPAAAESLFEDWVLDANRFAPARLVAAGMAPETAAAHAMEGLTRSVVEKLDRGASWAWSEELKPETPHGQAVVEEALGHWRPYLALGVSPAGLAADPDWSALGFRPSHEIHQAIKVRLSTTHADLARDPAAVARVDMNHDLFLPPADPTRSPWGPRARSDRRPPAPTPFAGPDAVNKVGPDPDAHGRYAKA